MKRTGRAKPTILWLRLGLRFAPARHDPAERTIFGIDVTGYNPKNLKRCPYLRSLIEEQIREEEAAWQAGYQQGFAEGTRLVAWRVLKHRFGRIPSWVPERLLGMSAKEAQELVLATIDGKSPYDLFGKAARSR